jgi:deferrochelatase/peroxidase EfeB
LAIGASADPKADFDYTNDPDGLGCPFGSHVRRMNPRGGPVAHKQPRPLLRRGLPYGEAWRKDLDEEQAAQPRGLMGHFFCASIEDQFEHLVGQWAERVPLGSPDPSRARDPFIGSHEPQDGAFVVPQAQGAPLRLKGLSRYTRTRGLAYLFYPSASTLAGIARSDLFLDRKGDDE